MKRRRLAILLLSALACSGPVYTIGDVEFSAPSGSGEPHLAITSTGSALLSWLEKVGERSYALQVAERTDGVWSAPRTVVRSDHFFVNWADFPSILELEDGSWVVHWLEKTAPATYAYHVKLAVSADRGKTWSQPIAPHRDTSPTEHGFVSMVPWGDGAAVLWLDGQQMARETEGAEGSQGMTGSMSVRFTTIRGDGTPDEDVLIDGRTCECCNTALTRTASGLVAAYRDRSEAEIRDIAVVRFANGTWSEPQHVGSDNWHYPGCPVNGPQLTARGDTVAVAWYAAPDRAPRVQVAFSTDGGESFGEPIRVDDGRPSGRVDIEFLEDGTAAVVWLELIDDAAEIRGRRVRRDGSAGRSWRIAATEAARASGFPRMTRLGNELLFAWTRVGDGGGVRVAALPLED